jgi:hypothetical protein
VDLCGGKLIRLVLLELLLIQYGLLLGGILVVTHGHVVVGGSREKLRLHVHILVRGVGVVHKGVAGRVLHDEGEGEASPIDEFLDLLDELIDLGSCDGVKLAAVLLQVRQTHNGFGQEAFNGAH